MLLHARRHSAPWTTTQEPFERVAILGLGLMGASLGMALRAAGVARVVTGYDAGPGVAERARERGAIDLACADVSQAVAEADLIVLAAPIRAAPDLFTAIAPYLAPGALVTDLCSVKAHIVACAERTLSDPSRFVGGHPMTGSERSGVEAARADLYDGCVWPLTPTARTRARGNRAPLLDDWPPRRDASPPRSCRARRRCCAHQPPSAHSGDWAYSDGGAERILAHGARASGGRISRHHPCRVG